MGGEQSKSEQPDNGTSNETCEVKVEEEMEITSEILWKKKVFELESEGDYFKEKFLLLETKVRLIKSDSDNLKNQVLILNTKVESLESEINVAMKKTQLTVDISQLEQRKERLEFQARPTTPPFKQILFPDSAYLTPLFPANISMSKELPYKKRPFSIKDSSGPLMKTDTNSKIEKIKSSPTVPASPSPAPLSSPSPPSPPSPPASSPAPASWIPNFGQGISPEIFSQFKQNKCELCDITLIPEDYMMNHYKGKKHLKKVKEVCQSKEEEVYNDELVVLSDNTKDVITVSDQKKVFIGCNICDTSQVLGVIILNSEGQELFEEVVPSGDKDEQTLGEASQVIENEVGEFVKFQSRLKGILRDNILVGYDLGKKLKALKLDHPQHLTRDISLNFPGLIPGSKISLELIAKKGLNISDYEGDQTNEAFLSQKIFNQFKTQCNRDEHGPIQNIECRLLMSKSVMVVMKKALRRKKLKNLDEDGIGFSVPRVGSVVSLFGSDVESIGRALFNLLEVINYNQLETQLKLIVPSRLQDKRKDLVSSSNPPIVTIFSHMLPNSREKIVSFGGDYFVMVSGVSLCLKLMEEEFCGYGGPGISYDCSDHDDLTADMYGGWTGDGRAPDGEGTTASCSSCLSMLSVEHFSWTQISKGEERRCYSCVSL